jgi:hypothetical protein
MPDQLGRGAAAALLVELGQLARDGNLAPGQHLADRRERLLQPRRRLEKHQRRAHRTQFGQHLGARLVLWRQEPGEQEAVARQACQRQRHDRGARPGQAGDRDPRGARVAHQAVPGIGYQRRARVADEDHGLAAHRLEQPLAVAVGAVIVVTPQRPGNPQVPQELGRHSRVLAGDRVAARKDVGCAHRHVAEVAYRGRDNIEAGWKRFGSVGVAHAVLVAQLQLEPQACWR